MNAVIKDLQGVDAYLDDVVTYDDNPEDHVRFMRAILERLRQHHDLKLSPSMATMGTTKADLFGHTISPDGVLRNATQAAALADMPMPRAVRQLRSLAYGWSRLIPPILQEHETRAPCNGAAQKRSTFHLHEPHGGDTRGAKFILASNTT